MMFEQGAEPGILRQPARLSRTCCTGCTRCGSAAAPRRDTRWRCIRRRCSCWARIAAALLGTLAVWLLYLTGARLFGRGGGTPGGGAEAVAFLPVFYAHLALNDVPTLAPLTLSLLGASGVLRKGRRRDYALAGIGLGLGCASKYTAGIVVAPLLAAAVSQYLDAPAARAAGGGRSGAGGRGWRWRASSWPTPTRCLTSSAFHAELNHQSQLSGEAQGKLGAGHEGGVRYYLWSLTWGAGLAAGAGGARRGANDLAPRAPRWAGCWCRRRCCSWRSWACRVATSGAGCCRSSRSSACWRRSSRPRVADVADRARRGPSLGGRGRGPRCRRRWRWRA